MTQHICIQHIRLEAMASIFVGCAILLYLRWHPCGNSPLYPFHTEQVHRQWNVVQAHDFVITFSLRAIHSCNMMMAHQWAVGDSLCSGHWCHPGMPKKVEIVRWTRNAHIVQSACERQTEPIVSINRISRSVNNRHDLCQPTAAQNAEAERRVLGKRFTRIAMRLQYLLFILKTNLRIVCARPLEQVRMK